MAVIGDGGPSGSTGPQARAQCFRTLVPHPKHLHHAVGLHGNRLRYPRAESSTFKALCSREWKLLRAGELIRGAENYTRERLFQKRWNLCPGPLPKPLDLFAPLPPPPPKETTVKTARLLALVFVAALSLPTFGADPMELSLLDGSKIKGRIMTATASEVTVMSDFGVLRLPLEKLTAESRAKVGEGAKPDTEAMARRIAELEAKVAQLQTENESLRAQRVATPAPTYRPSGVNSFSSGGASTTGATSQNHTISSTGKRHNSNCRYFGTGRACSPSEGIACKICGG